MTKITQCLLIEDDLEDQEIFLTALTKVDSHIKCAVVDSAMEALEKLERNENYIPDLIFIDINMPMMNGIECLAKIKKIDRLKTSLKFLYSTAEVLNFPAGIRLGPNNFILKRSSVSEMAIVLEDVLKKHQIGELQGIRTTPDAGKVKAT